ncbi:MAG TPA: discoidin domain-containing protein [Acidobacteriota bacterium]
MNSQRRHTLMVLGLFIILTLAMTYPLVLHLGSSVRDPGDPLLNTWILAWNNRQMAGFHLAGWFDANIYYPNQNTLAYSEHLFSQALVSLPVNLLTGNPILAYNLVLLFGFVTSGLGMYLLARRLSGHVLGSLAAGIIFAFSPFMMAHLPHLQVITAGGIPLTFLFLIRFFDSGRWKDLLLFTLFYVLQALANGYYALFLTILAGLFIMVMTVTGRKWREGRFWLQMAVFAVVALAALSPFLYHYAQVRNTLGLERGIGAYARATSFLATSPQNVFYGRLTNRFLQSEGELFPGVAAFILAMVGGASVLRLQKRRRTEEQLRPRPGGRILLWLAAALLLAQSIILSLTLARGSFELALGSFLKIHSRSPLKPLLAWVVFFLVFLLIKKIFRTGPLFPLALTNPVLGGLVLVFLTALWMTFGPNGPFLILYRYVPGFEGLRAPTRCHVFIMMVLAAFAAFGLRTLTKKLGAQKKGALAFLALLLILAEFLSLPVPLTSVPVKKDIPAVYRWLAEQKGQDFALLELPFPQEGQGVGSVECSRAYFSAYHWKRLVNGYSGYFPPLYSELRRRWNGGCSLSQNVRDLKALGVRYIIFHSSMFPPEAMAYLRTIMASRQQEMVLAGKFGEADVYEVVGWKEGLEKFRGQSPFRGIEPKDWKVSASVNMEAARLAMDGRRETRWDTAGPQQPGQFFEVDLGRSVKLAKLSLALGSSESDYPRRYRVEVSQDGRTWTVAAEEDEALIDIRAYLRPKNLSLDILLPNVPARIVRIINLGEDPVLFWSIHEIEIYSAQ